MVHVPVTVDCTKNLRFLSAIIIFQKLRDDVPILDYYLIVAGLKHKIFDFHSKNQRRRTRTQDHHDSVRDTQTMTGIGTLNFVP